MTTDVKNRQSVLIATIEQLSFENAFIQLQNLAEKLFIEETAVKAAQKEVELSQQRQLKWERGLAHLDESTRTLFLNAEKEAIWRIEQAQASQATSLDLQGLSLGRVPEAIKSLNQLTQLNLSKNRLANGFEPLYLLSNTLESLDVSQNTYRYVSNNYPLPLLPELDDNGQLSDLSSLQSLNSLKELKLANNQIKDVQPLSHLTKLELLDLNHNEISDFSPLCALTQLVTLNLECNAEEPNWNWKSDKEPFNLDLKCLPKLQNLYLHGIYFSKRKPFRFEPSENCLPQLRAYQKECVEKKRVKRKQQRIAQAAQQNDSILFYYKKMEDEIEKAHQEKATEIRLDLSYMDSKSIEIPETIQQLASLEVLTLEGWKVGSEKTELAVLHHLPKLRRLEIYNLLFEVQELEGLSALTSLVIGSCQITDTRSLQALTALTELQLNDEQLESFDLDLTRLPNLNILVFHQSPIKNIPSLILRGNSRFSDHHNRAHRIRNYQIAKQRVQTAIETQATILDLSNLDLLTLDGLLWDLEAYDNLSFLKSEAPLRLALERSGESTLFQNIEELYLHGNSFDSFRWQLKDFPKLTHLDLRNKDGQGFNEIPTDILKAAFKKGCDDFRDTEQVKQLLEKAPKYLLKDWETNLNSLKNKRLEPPFEIWYYDAILFVEKLRAHQKQIA